MLRGPSTVHHARDGSLDVDPKARARKSKRRDHPLSGENRIRRRDQHASGRDIDDAVADEPKVALSNDLAGDLNGVTHRPPAILDDPATHRSLHESQRALLERTGPSSKRSIDVRAF